MKDNIYILKSYTNSQPVIKVGYSADIPTRFQQYKSHNPGIELLHTFYREDGLLFEQTIHDTFEASHKREWYSEEDLPRILEWIANTTQITPKVIKLAKEEKAKLALLNKARRVKKAIPVADYTVTTKSLVNFETTANAVHELTKNIYRIHTEEEAAYLTAAYKKYPYLKDALDYLGIDGMKGLEFNTTYIKRELIKAQAVDKENKTIKLLALKDIRVGSTYTKERLKAVLSEIYAQLGIEAKAKASDIERFFYVKAAKTMYKNKPAHAFTLIAPKFIINKTN